MAAVSAAEAPPAETTVVEAQDSAAPSPLKQRKLDFDKAEDDLAEAKRLSLNEAASESPISIAADRAHVHQLWKAALLGDGGSDSEHHEGAASSSKAAAAVEPAPVEPTPVQPAQARASVARGPVVHHTPPTLQSAAPPGCTLHLDCCLVCIVNTSLEFCSCNS